MGFSVTTMFSVHCSRKWSVGSGTVLFSPDVKHNIEECLLSCIILFQMEVESGEVSVMYKVQVRELRIGFILKSGKSRH